MVTKDHFSLLHFSSENSEPFLQLIGKQIITKYKSKKEDFIKIEGVISGKIYFKAPTKENTFPFFIISKEELKGIVTENLLKELPE